MTGNSQPTTGNRSGPGGLGRREFARIGLATMSSVLVGRRFGSAQDTTAAGAADPLRRPDVIGATRRIVDSAQNDPVVVGIERRLRCTCGCGLDVFICRTTDFTCTYSPALHDEVVAQLGQGRDPDSAVAALVAKYGESILMAPKAEGFGILGYILPGAVIVAVGGLLIGLLARRGRRAVATVPRETDPLVESAVRPAAAATLETPDRLARLDRALQDLET